MQEVTITAIAIRTSNRDVPSKILRKGSQQMLTAAIEAEVAEWIESHSHLSSSRGYLQVVRNGYLLERAITTGRDSVKVRQPRVHDRRERKSERPLPPRFSHSHRYKD